MEKQIKKLNSPFAPNGAPRIKEEKGPDYYLSVKIIDVATKTGDGENDFVINKKVLIEKTPIQDVIDADAESCGVYNIIKQFMRTGDESILPRDDGKHSGDFVGAPESLMDVKALGQKAEADFSNLPPELVKKMDMKSFVESMDQEQFNAFVKAVADRTSVKKVEEKKDGE